MSLSWGSGPRLLLFFGLCGGGCCVKVWGGHCFSLPGRGCKDGGMGAGGGGLRVGGARAALMAGGGVFFERGGGVGGGEKGWGEAHGGGGLTGFDVVGGVSAGRFFFPPVGLAPKGGSLVGGLPRWLFFDWGCRFNELTGLKGWGWGRERGG